MIREQLSNSCGYSSYTNPAPVIQKISLADLAGNRHPQGWPGLIDTGADSSVVPLTACHDLGLKPRDWADLRGYDHKKSSGKTPIYYVRVQIDGIGDFSLRAYGIERESLLIGRDLLSNLVLIVDGKASRFVAGRHSGWTKMVLRALKLR